MVAKKLSKLAVVLVLVIANITLATGGNMGNHDGYVPDGSENSPWLIEDFADFQEFCGDTSKWASWVYTRLECDLDLNPTLSGRQIYSHAPIAGDDADTDSYFDGTEYCGKFDGNGHVISNLSVSGAYYCGLFGRIGFGEVI